MTAVCKRFFVSGRVQGVFFRASTARVARGLGLTGFARNLADGRVEVLACGADGALSELEQWLWQGSTASSVQNVSAEIVDVDAPASFSTG